MPPCSKTATQTPGGRVRPDTLVIKSPRTGLRLLRGTPVASEPVDIQTPVHLLSTVRLRFHLAGISNKLCP